MPERRILLAMLMAVSMSTFTSFYEPLTVTALLQMQSADDTLKALVHQLLVQQSLALMMILPGLACLPLRLRDLQRLPMERTFWSIRQHNPSLGFWEKQVKGDWANALPHYERSRYIQAFRMDKPMFNWLYEHYGRLLGKSDTTMRECVPADKRLAIFLSWLSNGTSFHALACTYDVSKAVVGNIIHDAVYIFRKHMVTESIKFPTGGELVQVMTDFEGLCKLPGCCGAIDGTFTKPAGPWGDVYYCYKKYSHYDICMRRC